MGINAVIDRVLAARNHRKRDKLVAFCRDHILRGEGLRILDLGCGSGLLADGLRALPCVASVTGADVLDYRKVAIPFIGVCQGGRLPVADNEFDITFLVEVLHHADNPDHLLAEALRVAGRMVVVFEDVVTGPVRHLLMRGFDVVMNMRHGVNTPLNFRSEEQWRRTFESFGLTIDAVHDYSFYSIPTPQKSKVFTLGV